MMASGGVRNEPFISRLASERWRAIGPAPAFHLHDKRRTAVQTLQDRADARAEGLGQATPKSGEVVYPAEKGS
jgi:hypothetical protein